MEYLGDWGTLIHEKNLKSKISCQTPFKWNILILRESEEAESSQASDEQAPQDDREGVLGNKFAPPATPKNEKRYSIVQYSIKNTRVSLLSYGLGPPMPFPCEMAPPLSVFRLPVCLACMLVHLIAGDSTETIYGILTIKPRPNLITSNREKTRRILGVWVDF